MAYERLTEESLDYYPCHYGGSRLLFRGPRKSLDGDYIAFLGSTEIYGKFVRRPFPDMVGEVLGLTAVNFGCVNAGIEVFDQDAEVQAICKRAKITVLQVMGAANMSNRLYTVHPRRNDRFLRASRQLRTIYPEVDFTQFHFTRHLLRSLKEASPAKFRVVERELCEAWVALMSALIGAIGGQVVLVWMSERRPEDAHPIDVASEPLMVNRRMLSALAPQVLETVEIVTHAAAGGAGLDGMVFSDVEAPVAAALPGLREHRAVAEALAPCLAAYLSKD